MYGLSEIIQQNSASIPDQPHIKRSDSLREEQREAALARIAEEDDARMDAALDEKFAREKAREYTARERAEARRWWNNESTDADVTDAEIEAIHHERCKVVASAPLRQAEYIPRYAVNRFMGMH